ncbi:glycerol kinase GlpK [Bacillaceae bacterium SIJ1]|uniref:glycerol kinase GlpK n=1 Tax=Litoribacterium kuwaitense TaxID=1398745 RepID=UPI0013EA3747|nr:glycerol kinase GlpK [Litoribacterium kuwaitense]NGP45381.1 glycerol kinase GlpK [Litoribacterium kuwaitense]
MAGKKYFIGLDQGTTGTTTLILDEAWNIHSQGYMEHTQYYPQPGWVEHDPLEIWEKTKESIRMALEKGYLRLNEITAMGLDNQGETVVVWDKTTGMPIYNAIVWQDRRTAQEADRLQAEWGDVIKEKTGVIVESYFSALKIKWVLDEVEGAREKAEKGELLAGTIDTWLIWKMTAGKLHMTDYSTASRTMLMNIHDGCWDEDILERLTIPKSMMAEIRSSSEYYGETEPASFMGAKVPIAGSVVDQQAALFGQACFEPGTVKTTYGTGCFMLMNTGEKIVDSPNGLLTTVAWGLDGKMSYALDGGIYITGAAIQWLRDGLNIIETAQETENLARSVPDNGGVYFVPAFVGLAAPHWDQYARGTMIGITGGTTKAHIVRATLESIAYQVKENMEVMEKDSGIKIQVMRVDGGPVVNDFLMQFQADLLGIPIDVPMITETTALGAAYLAGMAVGEFDNLEAISAKWKLSKRYMPKIDEGERQQIMNRWRRAVERSKNWIENDV